MEGTQLWYCDICDKTIKIKSKSKHINSKSHKHKEKFGVVLKGYEFIKPDNDEVNYLLNDTINDCRKKYFHSFEHKCVYGIKFENFTTIKEVVLTITLGYMELKSQIYGLSKKSIMQGVTVLYLIK